MFQIFIIFSQVRDNDFESALETFGIDALLFRSMQLCPESMSPVFKDFRVSWRWLEIDRIRRKTPGLTMRTAQGLYLLCKLLNPPVDLPQEKGLADRLLNGPRCSPWTAVLALRELGAFTDASVSVADDHDW